MSILHVALQINEKTIKWAKDIQRKKKDKADIRALMLKTDDNHTVADYYDYKKKTEAFWRPYGRTDPIYQKYYFEKNDIRDIRYIPDDLYYTKIQYYYNDILAAKIVDHKGYYETLFPDIHHPKTLAKRINDFWLVDNRIMTKEQVFEVIHSEELVFIKPATDTCGGKGIAVLEGESLCEDRFFEAISSIKGDIVVQQKAEQCDELSQLNAFSTNTIRIMTLLDKKGEVVILSRSLRMGVGKSRLDNAHSGGISIGIKEDGQLKQFALTLDGKRFYTHPNTGIVFNQIVVPCMKEVDDAVIKCALRVPAFRIVAWDVILDTNHVPVLIEANLFNAGMDVPQLNNGPLFGERTAEFLDEVYNHR